LNGNRIVKITPNGVSTTLAGSTNDAKGSADGTGTDATFYGPRGLAVDVNGNLYVADRENNKIRKITPDGVVSTLAGSGAEGSVDGTGTMAAFFHPSGIAVDTSGNVYVGDVNNEDSTLPFNKIRKITPDGVVYTLTGSGNSDPSDPNRSVDGNKTTAGIYYPAGLAVNNGIIFVAEADGQKIRKITSNGDVTTLAGSGTMDSIDGTGTGASFATPVAVAIHSRTGDLYVVDEEFSKLRRVTQSGVVTTLKIGLPNGIPLFFDPDPITNTTELAGVAFDPSSKYLYLTDATRDMVYKFEVK
jgi:sugar lactone lactonase YvrE